MRISAKGHYGLAAMVFMAGSASGSDLLTTAAIADKLGISKIYLEQVFSLLKKGGLVRSVKGAQGGYMLAVPPEKTTALQILKVVEDGLFEEPGRALTDKGASIDAAMRDTVFDPMDSAVRDTLDGVTLAEIARAAAEREARDVPMFYI